MKVPPGSRKMLPGAYAVALAWVNIYICREISFLDYAPYMNSMHGSWMALARYDLHCVAGQAHLEWQRR